MLCVVPSDDPVLWVLDDQDGDVDASGQPAVFLAHEVRVVDDAHDACEAESSLVNGLEEVCEDHHGENALVDLLAKLDVLLGRDFDPRIRYILSQLLVDGVVVLVAFGKLDLVCGQDALSLVDLGVVVPRTLVLLDIVVGHVARLGRHGYLACDFLLDKERPENDLKGRPLVLTQLSVSQYAPETEASGLQIVR